MMNTKDIKKDFPILKRTVEGKPLVYLDNAATTQKPRQVIDAISGYYENHNANIHRGLHMLSEEATDLYEKAHEDVGNLLHAKNPVEEVVFTKNATEALNLAAHSLNLKRGDEVITTIMEHHSNIVPWQMLREKGVKVSFADIDEHGLLDVEDLKEKMTKDTKVVTCVHASNLVGTINPVREIGKTAHDNGAVFVVDGAQSVPHMNIDVKKIDADLLAFSGHKMLGPTGTGVLFGKTELLQNMSPFLTGGDMIKEVKKEKSTWNELPWKFEAGTPNVAGAVGLSAAISYLKKLGMEDIRKHEVELTRYALEKLDMDGIDIYGPKQAEKRSGLVSFNILGVHPHDVSGILNSEYGVATRSGHHCAQPLTERLGQHSTTRASFYIYNDKEDIDVLAEGIKKVRSVFSR